MGKRAIIRHGIPLALLAALAASPVWGLPAPLPVAWIGLDVEGSASCPLHWHPGEPAGLFPHPPPATEGSAALGEASRWVARAEARGWIEVGRPDRALAVLGAVLPGPEDRLYRLAALAGLERWEELARELAATPPTGLPTGCGPLRDRWAAESAAVVGDPVAADRAWERLAAALPQLGAYVDLWRLEAAARTGDVPRGEAAWIRVSAGGLPGPALADARAARARLHERAGRPAEARRWYLAAAEDARGIRRAELRLAAARQAELAGDRAGADALRAAVLAAEPAAAADLVLDPGIRGRLRVSAVDAARALAAAGRLAEAEPLATAAVGSGSGDEAVREALLLRAEIRARRGNRAGAEADYAAFLARWPRDPHLPEALYERARLALRFGDGAVARRRFENLMSRFPSHPKSHSALYLLADSYQDDRTRDPAYVDRAIEHFDRLVLRHPGSHFADRAYMRAAHLSYAVGRLAEAERRYAAYRGNESAREARYWLARTLERRGDVARAREILASLARDDDYYALLARDRLARRPRSFAFDHGGYRSGPLDPYDTTGTVILSHPAGRTAVALLAMGERHYAQAELERAVAALGGDRDRLEAWAPALAAWGFPGLTLRIGVRLGGERHRHAWPAGFATAIDREARAHDLDPWYVLALVRQESLYRSDVVSPADARGLMQILPATGREIAAASGWADFDAEDLFQPAINLHFGARYLEDQLVRFDGFWPAVLAAYNGGPHVVAVWWDFPERTLDPELWIDRIPYKETREYVRKVAAQAARYRQLHEPASHAR